MTSPRARRLTSDRREMELLAARGAFSFEAEGVLPERYRVRLEAPGLALRDGGLTVRRSHRFDLYLHRDYPRRPPVVQWQTPIFHPNLLGPERNGGVCIGSWSPAEGLADLCLRLRELVTYAALNAADALDEEAAAWVREHGVTAGDDLERLARLASSPPVAGESAA